MFSLLFFCPPLRYSMLRNTKCRPFSPWACYPKSRAFKHIQKHKMLSFFCWVVFPEVRAEKTRVFFCPTPLKIWHPSSVFFSSSCLRRAFSIYRRTQRCPFLQTHTMLSFFSGSPLQRFWVKKIRVFSSLLVLKSGMS